MKAILGCFLALLALTLSGCQTGDRVVDGTQYLRVRVEPNSADTCITALMPAINRMDESWRQIITQNAWLVRSLDKCIAKLEAERGFESIPRKYENFLRGDPNILIPPEPWYEPYEHRGAPGRSAEPASIRMLICLMNISSLNMRNQIADSEQRIENFEKRLKRIEEHSEK